MSSREPRRAAAGESDWLTLGQAAKFLGVAQSTIRKWSDPDASRPSTRPAGTAATSAGDLEAFLERSGPGRPARGPLVLLVDDDEKVREVVRINLEMEGYTVREASNGEDGLAALEEDSPDLILLDVMMPQVDGWEMLRRVQERHGVGSIPVVMFSGQLDARVRRRSAGRRASWGSRSTSARSSSRRSRSSPPDVAGPRSQRWFVQHRAGWLDSVFESLSYAGRLGLSGSRSRSFSPRCTGGGACFSSPSSRLRLPTGPRRG